MWEYDEHIILQSDIISIFTPCTSLSEAQDGPVLLTLQFGSLHF